MFFYLMLFVSQVTKLIEETKAPKTSKSAVGEDRILDWLVNEKVLSIALEGWQSYHLKMYKPEYIYRSYKLQGVGADTDPGQSACM